MQDEINQKYLNVEISSANNWLPKIKALIEMGANPNLPLDKDGHTLIHYLAESGSIREHLGYLEFLLKNGVSPNIVDNKGLTALMYATSGVSRHVIVKLLHEHGADIHIRSNDGDTALLFSAIRNKASLLWLVDHGADINARNNIGYTALMYASRANNSEIVRLLIDLGVDINEQNIYGMTALQIAVKKNFHDVASFLKSFSENGVLSSTINTNQNLSDQLVF